MTLTALHLLAELGHVVRPDGAQELDVVVAVVLCHLLCRGFVRPLRRGKKTAQTHKSVRGKEVKNAAASVWSGETYVDFHLPVQSIVEQQVVGHTDAVRFHGVSLAVVVVSDVACRGHMFTCSRPHLHWST